MKTPTKWMIAVAGVLVLSAGVGRAIMARKAQQQELAQSSTSAQAAVVVLSSRDVVTASVQPLRRSLPVSGTLTAQRSAIVKAKVSAELQSLDVREGEAVKAGQVIGRFDDQEYASRLRQAEQQAAAAKAQWQIARQNLDNSQALVKQGFVSRNALDTALSNEAAARATHEAAQSAVELAGKAVRDTVVRAPIDGLIAQRFVQPGERVNVDGRIVEVVDLRSLELQAPLSPADVLQIRVGTPAALQVEGLSRPIAAHVARINPSASADTRNVMVYLALDDHASLRQGLFVQGHIRLDEKQALIVPASAVVRDAGHAYVLKVSQAAAGQAKSSSGQVQRVKVTLGVPGRVGENTQEMVEVADGLSGGDVVLSQGTGTVSEGQRVKLSGL
ncbi:MAG: efflux RND transporter periplasmic adaptor subunit [Aquabacterium sp.]